MDPQACLDMAFKTYKDGDLDAAREALADYFHWRNGSGFQPKGGDFAARELECKLYAWVTLHGRTEDRVELKETAPVRSGTTASGYGSRMPTAFMVRYVGRWYRVYCVGFSNAGTLYITARGKRVVVRIR